MRERIDDAIDAMLEPLLGALGMGGKEDEGDGEHDGEIGDTVSFSAGGEGHRLWIDGTGAVMVASTPMTVQDRIRNWEGRINDGPSAKDGVGAPSDAAPARSALSAARKPLGMVEDEVDDVPAASEEN